MTIRDLFVDEIKNLMHRRGVGKSQLCEATGVSRSFLDEFLQKKKDISLDTFNRLLAGFKPTPEIVFVEPADVEKAKRDVAARILESSLHEAIKQSRKAGTFEHFLWAFNAAVSGTRPSGIKARRGRSKESSTPEVDMADPLKAGGGSRG